MKQKRTFIIYVSFLLLILGIASAGISSQTVIDVPTDCTNTVIDDTTDGTDGSNYCEFVHDYEASGEQSGEYKWQDFNPPGFANYTNLTWTIHLDKSPSDAPEFLFYCNGFSNRFEYKMTGASTGNTSFNVNMSTIDQYGTCDWDSIVDILIWASNTDLQDDTTVKIYGLTATKFTASGTTAPTIDTITVTGDLANNTNTNWTGSWTASDSDNDALYNFTWFNTTGKQLVLGMDFNNGSAVDLSVEAHTIDNNTATYSSSGGFDGSGAFTFDGTDDWINISDGIFTDKTASRSICFRFKISNNMTGGADAQPFIVTNGIYMHHRNNSEGLSIRYDNGGAKVSNAGVYSDDKWHHTCGIYDNSTPETFIYVDGSLSENNTEANRPSTTYEGWWGIGQSDGTYLNGTIDDVRIYDYVLSAAQVLNLYQNNSHILSDSETSGGETWTFNVRTTDTTYYTGASTYNFDVKSNNAPTVTITNDLAEGYDTDDILSINVTPADLDGDTISINVTWYVENAINYSQVKTGISNGTLTEFLLGSGNFSDNEEVKALVFANDGTINSTAVWTTTITIGNEAPSAPTLNNISNNTAREDNFIITFDYNVSDIDNDDLTCSLKINDVVNVTNSSISSGSNVYNRIDFGFQTGNFNWSVNCSDGNLASSSGVFYWNFTDDTPDQTTGLAYTATDTTIALTWTASTDNDIEFYYVYRSDSAGGTYSQINYTSSASHTDTGLTAESTFYYIVSAKDLAGNYGANSTALQASTSSGDSPSGPGGPGDTPTTPPPTGPTNDTTIRTFCGDLVCDEGENPGNCFEDCPVNIDNIITCLFNEDIACIYEDAWFAQFIIFALIVGAIYLGATEK